MFNTPTVQVPTPKPALGRRREKLQYVLPCPTLPCPLSNMHGTHTHDGDVMLREEGVERERRRHMLEGVNRRQMGAGRKKPAKVLK